MAEYLPTLRTCDDDLVLWDVVGEHLDEASFALERFDRALLDPTHTLSTLAKGPEFWLRAHLDGLVVGGAAVGERLLRPAVGADSDDDPFRQAAALSALLLGGDVESPIEGLMSEHDSVWRASVRASQLFGSMEFDRRIGAELAHFVNTPPPPGLATAAATRRVRPTSMEPWFESSDPAVLTAALKLGRQAPAPGSCRSLQALLTHHAEEVRREALVTSLTLRCAWALGRCEDLAFNVPTSPWALPLFCGICSFSDHRRVLDAAQDEELRKSALFALAFSGNPAVLDPLLAYLDDDDEVVRRLAAQAIHAIAGPPIEEEPFARFPPPATGEPSYLPESDAESREALPLFEEDDLDADLGLNPILALPEPDRCAFERWWSSCRHDFSTGSRYGLGRELDRHGIDYFLRNAPLPLRGQWVDVLSIGRGASILIDTGAPSSVQEQQICGAAPVLDHDSR